MMAGWGAMAPTGSEIPRDRAVDSTLAFLREGYAFIANRCERLHSDAFLTRLMMHDVVCMRGPDATAAFYREGRFTRRGAMPRTALALLQDRGSVQMLDGAAHHHRKRMFMSAMTAPSIARARHLFAEEWRQAAEQWAGRRIVLHDALGTMLTRTALRWCGIAPEKSDPQARAEEVQAMIAAAGSIGPQHLRARYLRRRTERWAATLIQAIRDGEAQIDRTAPAATVATHHGRDGALLDRDTAAVELINLLRPIVATGRFIVFAAHALHENPSWARRLADNPADDDLTAFVQEVRRYYPFFPAVGGRVVDPFTWHGHDFARGDWVLLDLFGTDRHPGAWRDADRFMPERFLDSDAADDALVPQGGGDYWRGHRCPGEWLTIALVGEATRLLATQTRYAVPDQDLAIPLDRLPTMPRSGFIMDVR